MCNRWPTQARCTRWANSSVLIWRAHGVLVRLCMILVHRFLVLVCTLRNGQSSVASVSSRRVCLKHEVLAHVILGRSSSTRNWQWSITYVLLNDGMCNRWPTPARCIRGPNSSVLIYRERERETVWGYGLFAHCREKHCIFFVEWIVFVLATLLFVVASLCATGGQ